MTRIRDIKHGSPKITYIDIETLQVNEVIEQNEL